MLGKQRQLLEYILLVPLKKYPKSVLITLVTSYFVTIYYLLRKSCMSLMVAISLSVFKHLQIQRSTFYAHIFGVTFTITTENAQQRFARNYIRNFNVWYVLLYMVLSTLYNTVQKKKFQRIARYTNVLPFILSMLNSTHHPRIAQEIIQANKIIIYVSYMLSYYLVLLLCYEHTLQRGGLSSIIKLSNLIHYYLNQDNHHRFFTCLI